jgi:hypothetical protein
VDCAGKAPRAERPSLELADVFRAVGVRMEGLSSEQRQAAGAITRCRTAALGGHVDACGDCGHREISYNSCRNRHCPKCQGLSQARWVEARQQDLLPVEYFHVVFTVPDDLNPLFLANPRAAIDLLFSAAAETVQDVALTPKHLGARVGLTAVLHTWTQKLLYHPHLHCIVPGGGLDPSGKRWISCRPGFFLPVRVFSKVFRGKLLSRLEDALTRGKLKTPGGADAKQLLRKASCHDWVVYSKPPFAGPEQVIRYLGQYTHRIALSNHRLVSMENGQVTFRWKDRADGDQKKLLTLDAVQFLRRFLLHVLPRGLVRIRHYGLLANSVRKQRLEICRKLLDAPVPAPKSDSKPETWQALMLRLTGKDVTICPACHKGHMVRTELLPPALATWSLPGRGTSP